MIDLDLIEQIYDVVLGRSSWTEIAGRLSKLFRADITVLAAAGPDVADMRGLGATGFDLGLLPVYGEHFAEIDPYLSAIRGGTAPLGRAFRGEQVISDKDLLRTELYWDWLRPLGVRFTVGAALEAPDRSTLFLTMPRSPRAGTYGAADVLLCQAYFNHIGRALELQEALAGANGGADMDRFAIRYRLTAAESRLVELLAETGSLKKSAQRTQRSYNTLRAQLRSVLQKTQTRSQIQLLGLVHRSGAD